MTAPATIIAPRQLVAAVLERLIISAPLPLRVQSLIIWRLMPLAGWPKSLMYQQCMANRIIGKYGPVSRSGPFKGMTCLRDAKEGCLVPKLIGCYEEELIPTFERFFAKGFDRFIDVGCASGYWLTGVATRMPEAECFGFEADAQVRARCSELLRLNGVHSRVELHGLCKPGDFEDLIQGRTLLLMDVDGPEYDLLDPEASPGLRRADIIVECHDYLDPRIMPTLKARFERSHSIEEICSRIREPCLERYPALDALPERHWVEALAERRPAVQTWLVMKPRT